MAPELSSALLASTPRKATRGRGAIGPKPRLLHAANVPYWEAGLLAFAQLRLAATVANAWSLDIAGSARAIPASHLAEPYRLRPGRATRCLGLSAQRTSRPENQTEQCTLV